LTVTECSFTYDTSIMGCWANGEGPGNCFDGMTTLAALAPATTRIRLGLLVAGVTYRHPSVFAAQALTIDHASHGRLDLSLGAAWFGPEHHTFGIPFPAVGARFDLLDDAQMRPLPVQRPHPPIWLGTNGPRRGLPAAAKWADVWHTFAPAEHYAVMSRRVDQLAEEAGRDPAAIRRAGSLSISEPWDEVRRNADALRAVGVSYLVCSWPGDGEARVGEFAERVMSEFTE